MQYIKRNLKVLEIIAYKYKQNTYLYKTLMKKNMCIDIKTLYSLYNSFDSKSILLNDIANV